MTVAARSFRHVVLDIVERFINGLMRVRAHLGS